MQKDDESEEDISIDFGRIKNIFSRKKHSKEAHHKDVEEAHEKHVQHVIEDKDSTIGDLKKESVPVVHATKVEPAEEDDSVDFSKITGFFKKKEHHQESHAEKSASEHKPESDHEEKTHHPAHHVVSEEPKKKEDEEVAIDFTKIKNIFKPKHKDKVAKDSENSEDISINWKKIGSFFVNYQIILLILIPLIISVQLRSVPITLPITDDWARSSVDNYFRSQIQAQVNQQYPNLPDANKQQFVDSEYQKFTVEQKAMLDQQIQGTSQYFKAAMQDKDGHTYLPDIDTYFWLRHARNIVEHGYPGDKIVNGTQIDDHMIAPIGRVLPGDMFNSYFVAYSYEFWKVFSNTAELDRTCFFMPIIFSALSIIPAFFIARRLGGNFAGFVAAALVAIHPAFLVRSTGGVCDTDAYNVFFPLVITWLFIEAVESRSKVRMVVLSILSGFFTALYSFAWGGWWFIFDFLLAASVIYLAYLAIINMRHLRHGIRAIWKIADVQHLVIFVLVFFVTSMVFVTFFHSFASFNLGIFNGPSGFSQIKSVGTAGVWPNVFTTVAEQNQVNFQGIIDNIGGTFLVCLAVFGIIVIAFVKDESRRHNVKYAILLAIWFVATLYASTKGVRWVLLLVPAFSIALGVTAGFLYKLISNYLHKEFSINSLIAKIVMILLLISLIFFFPKNMVDAAQVTVKNEIPLINRAWVDSLTYINQNSEKNAIVNSWWDYGHWFKYYTDRAVTFDGTSQDSPMAYWIGKTLLTDNEDSAVGILRMLDCGSFTAFDELDKVIKEPYKSVDILNKIVLQDKVSAAKTLAQYGLSQSQVDSVLARTHCNPPEDFFIASEDMVGKSGVWAHFGSWDFRKATIYNKVRNMDQTQGIDYMKSQFNYSTEDARSLFYQVKSLDPNTQTNDWIAPWPSYASNEAGCTLAGTIVTCESVGLKYDLSTQDATLMTQQGAQRPVEIVIPTTTGLFRKSYNNNTLPYSVALIPSGSSYSALLMQPALSASMFTLMFYMQGHSLKHFKLVDTQKSPLGTVVYVYKVDWNGTAMNVLPDVANQQKYLEERHVRHILVNNSAEADLIYNELKQGANFALLAKNYSLDSSAAQGGDIGWVKYGQTIPQFEAAVFNMTVNQISKPVQTTYGYHIIQLLAIRNQTKS